MGNTLRAMAYIYASAELTIAGAGGTDANSGLKRQSSRTHAYQWDTTWATRGWTFQESLFSRRLLVFENGMTWMCGLDYREESLTGTTLGRVPANWTPTQTSIIPTDRPHLGISMGLISLLPKIPSLGRWGMIVENFSERSLTFVSDICHALAGATEVMRSTFAGGIVHGLPTVFFDIALLWQPRARLSRRTGEPSWSWLGWKGAVDCLSPWHPFFAGLFRVTGHSTDWTASALLQPVAKYRFSVGQDNEDTILSNLNGFYEYQALREASAPDLPPGWTKCDHPDGHYYISTTDGQQRRYAFPLPLAPQSPLASCTFPSSVLLCTAPHAMLQFWGPRFGSYSDDTRHKPSKSLLLVIKGTEVGDLTPHSSEASGVSLGTLCELVAISQAEESDHEWSTGGYDRRLKAFQRDFGSPHSRKANRESFYNVMWIGWEGDVAYRRGLGTVDKTHWDALQAEVITFKLG
jgi:hypothetical protein